MQNYMKKLLFGVNNLVINVLSKIAELLKS